MTHIYVIRHAEAEGNLYRRGQGHYNAGITSRGYKQIDALAERFREIHVDAVYSSDLFRAMETAGAVTRYHNIPIQTTTKLREINLGAWEDRPWGNIEYEEFQQIHNFNADPENWIVDRSEPFPELAKRITSAAIDIAERHEGQTVVIVSHGMAIRTMLCHFLGYAMNEVNNVSHADNTAVSLLNYDEGRVTVEYCNDNSHLPNEISTLYGQSWWKTKSGTDRKNLRFEPMDIASEKELYTRCYADAWMESYGNMEHFDPEVYYERAVEHSEARPDALMKVMMGDDFAGLVELDVAKGKEDGIGWISLCYMAPNHRGKKLAIQLIGHAISVYGRLGRNKLGLNVSVGNKIAVAFYKRCDFYETGRKPGVSSELLFMQKDIVSR